MSANTLIGLLFLARDVAHSVHLNTRSYAKHSALGDFYPAVIDLADKFAEAYQGRKGLIGAIELTSPPKTDNVLQFLQGQLKDIEDMRYKVCDKADTTLQNIVDEIVSLYLSTIYKVRFLA
jgi:hypothetical protein